jgi:hypothetical protein
MGLPPADSSYLPVRARRRGAPETKLMLSRSNPFSFTVSSLPAALLRWATSRGRTNWSWIGGGRDGRETGERVESRLARPQARRVPMRSRVGRASPCAVCHTKQGESRIPVE